MNDVKMDEYLHVYCVLVLFCYVHNHQPLSVLVLCIVTVCTSLHFISPLARVRSKAFEAFFKDNPDSLLRMVQIVMLRLQRVTFLALNHFLGLGRELLNQVCVCMSYCVNKSSRKFNHTTIKV